MWLQQGSLPCPLISILCSRPSQIQSSFFLSFLTVLWAHWDPPFWINRHWAPQPIRCTLLPFAHSCISLKWRLLILMAPRLSILLLPEHYCTLLLLHLCVKTPLLRGLCYVALPLCHTAPSCSFRFLWGRCGSWLNQPRCIQLQPASHGPGIKHPIKHQNPILSFSLSFFAKKTKCSDRGQTCEHAKSPQAHPTLCDSVFSFLKHIYSFGCTRA